MSLIFLLSLILLFGTSVWYVIFPLFEGRSKIPALVSREELERKKIVFLRQIKELEMDHHIGNITDKDYEFRRNRLKKDISEIISELKRSV